MIRTFNSLLAGVSTLVLCFPSLASAQDGAPVAQENLALPDERTDTSADGGTRDIVVTGSRAVRDGTLAPTPLTVARTDDLAMKAPGSIAEGLNQLPVFQGAINASQAQVTQSNRVRSGNYLNLRNLGPQRLLVLQDGYRLPPSGNNGGVDTNIIPQMLIERVEVVTGGASAVYGSDAVSGVVNYIIDKNFKGMKALAQSGISTYGDAASYRLGVAGGASLLDDRLHVLVSAEHYKNKGINARRDRPGGADQWITGGRDPTLAAGPIGTPGNPFVDYPNVNFATASEGGLVINGPAGINGMQFLPDGRLAPYNRGAAIGRPGFGQGGDGADFCVYCTLVPENSTTQLFGRLSYEFSSDISGFVQASYNTAENYSESVVLGKVTGSRIANDNYYLRQQLTPTQLAALGSSEISINRIFKDWLVPGARPGASPSTQSMNSITVMTGLQGKLFGDWKWDAVYTYGRTEFESISAEPRNDRYFAAIDAVAGPTGSPVCRVTLTHPERFPGCRPLNVLGFARADSAAVDWIMGEARWRTINSMHIGAVNFSGSLFSTAAGPVTLAFGGEIRRQEIVQYTNSDPSVPVDYTGIPRGTGGAYFNTNMGTADGGYTIKEGYAELAIPLLKDAPLAKSLDLNGAFRYTQYSTSGGVETFKLGATWEPISDLRLRGTYSRDIRAPSLFELFAGQSIVENSVFDAVTQNVAIVGTRSGGNPTLRPEKSTTYTLGGAFSPRFLPGFTFSADYFNIKIDDAISTPGSSVQIFNACGTYPTSIFCSYIDRDPDGTPRFVRAFNQNVATLQTSGIDFELGYRTDLGNGNLAFRALATRLISFSRSESPVSSQIEYAGSADLPAFLSSTQPLPEWRGNLDITYTNNGWMLSVQERMIGGYKKSFQQSWVENDIPAVFYTDVSFAKDIETGSGSFQFFGTINNLTNRKGPFFVTDQNPGTQIPTARAVYDITGRYFTFGVRSRF